MGHECMMACRSFAQVMLYHLSALTSLFRVPPISHRAFLSATPSARRLRPTFRGLYPCTRVAVQIASHAAPGFFRTQKDGRKERAHVASSAHICACVTRDVLRVLIRSFSPSSKPNGASSRTHRSLGDVVRIPYLACAVSTPGARLDRCPWCAAPRYIGMCP